MISSTSAENQARNVYFSVYTFCRGPSHCASLYTAGAKFLSTARGRFILSRSKRSFHPCIRSFLPIKTQSRDGGIILQGVYHSSVNSTSNKYHWSNVNRAIIRHSLGLSRFNTLFKSYLMLKLLLFKIMYLWFAASEILLMEHVGQPASHPS